MALALAQEEITFWEIVKYILIFGLGAAIAAFGYILVAKAVRWFWAKFGIRIKLGLFI